MPFKQPLRFTPSTNRAQPWDLAAILPCARALHATAETGRIATLLHGRHIALLCGSPTAAGGSEEDALLKDAATRLGAQVAQITPGLWTRYEPGEIRQLAGVLERLYAAVACQGMPYDTVRRIAEATSIPVYDCIAADDHPTAALANLLEVDATPDEKRRLVLQAVLLTTIS